MGTAPKSSCGWRVAVFGARAVAWVVLAGMAAWSTAAIYYSNLPAPWLRSLAAVLYAVALLIVIVRVRPWWLARVVCLSAFAIVVAWFLLIPPSNNRDWLPDVAVLPFAEMNGQQVTIHNIRNCDYRTETEFDVHHYDKTLDLSKLKSVDFFVVYWGSPLIAHTMMSFGFEGGDFVCFSIETRKEKGETYSAIKGFFRQFELIYVIGDERDLVRVRTNFRGEQVYLYRLNTSLDVARLVFLDYLKEVNRLKDRAEWYNAITANCTTLIRGHTKPYAKNASFDWRILVNGHIDRMAYERKSIDQSLRFEQLKAQSLINERAKAADKDPEFSKRIREQLPGTAHAENRAQYLFGAFEYLLKEARPHPGPFPRGEGVKQDSARPLRGERSALNSEPRIHIEIDGPAGSLSPGERARVRASFPPAHFAEVASLNIYRAHTFGSNKSSTA